MNRFNRLVHISAGGVTALIWRYALVNYTFLSLNLHSFPLSAAILPIILAGVTTVWASGKGRRVISVLAIQLVSLALSGLAALYTYYPHTHPFWSYHWLLEVFSLPQDGQAWAVVALVLLAAVFFWWGGWFLGRRRSDPRSDFVRFDLGMSFFIMLFLTKFLLKVRGDIFIEDPLAMPLFAAFLIFGLIAIGATRQGERSEKQYLPGYAAIGSMAGFSIVIVLIGVGATIVLMPYLTQAADAGYQAISAVARPASQIITNLLRAMLSHKRNVDEMPTAGRTNDSRLSGMAEEAYDGSAEWIMYLLTVLIAIALLFGIALVARWLIKWLMSRTAGDTAVSKEMGFEGVSSLAGQPRTAHPTKNPDPDRITEASGKNRQILV